MRQLRTGKRYKRVNKGIINQHFISSNIFPFVWLFEVSSLLIFKIISFEIGKIISFSPLALRKLEKQLVRNVLINMIMSTIPPHG